MTKSLKILLGRADEIGAGKTELLNRRDQILAAKEKIFAEAQGDDAKAFARIGELGAQQNLVHMQIQKLDRELAGLNASILNEANHLRNALVKAGTEKRAKILNNITTALAPFLPNQKQRDDMLKMIAVRAPEVRLIEKLALSTNAFHPAQTDEVKFARGILAVTESAIEKCGL